MKRIHLQPTYVLHRRSYRESSFLIELFTQDHGRLSVVARGARKAHSSTQGLLQPFIPLLISWSGKGELMTLTHAELNGEVTPLRGECLFAGFYLNELLMFLLQKWDPHATLYTIYEKTLLELQKEPLQQKILRSFEKKLLEELGYAFLPKGSLSLHNSFSPTAYYYFVPEEGFVLSEHPDMTQAHSSLFLGKNLLAIANDDWQAEEVLQDAKRLTRMLLLPLLGSRPLYSRTLFATRGEKKR